MLYDELAKIQFSKQLYISGMRALNINDYEFLTGYWHIKETWHPESTVLTIIYTILNIRYIN